MCFYCQLFNFISFLFGGILTGVVASFVFYWVTRAIKNHRFWTDYNHLVSSNKYEFDWIAYSMRKEDGRMRQEESNGSKANISLIKNKLYITLTHDNRFWKGELEMFGFGYGIVAYKYTDKHEYGKRDCVIGFYDENGKRFDYIFLTPVNPRIFKIEKKTDILSKVEYNYGDEVLIRERVSN